MTKISIKNSRIKGLLAAFIASVLWSTGGVLIKYVDWNPMALAGMRSLISSLVILMYIKKPKITKSKAQMLGTISYACTVIAFVVANKLTTAANAILLQYTAPIFVAILGAWVLKEKIHWYDTVSIATVLLGMCLFFVEGINAGNTLGNIVGVFSGFTLACVTLSLRAQKDASSVETTWLGNILTFLVSIPFLFSVEFDIKSIIIVIILGTFQLGTAYIFYVNSLKYISALEAILITVFEPILNPIWVYIFTGERPGIYALIGGIIVIASVLLRSIYVSKKESAEEID